MTDMIKTRFDEMEIDRIFADIDQSQLPGAAVGIAIGGVPVYRKGFGLANMELPTLLTPGMRMRIGSTTKHFACLAYMLLVEDGLAGLDDPIGKYVSGLSPVNGAATMRRLMGHTSGIRDLLSVTMSVHGVNRPVTDEQMLAYYETIDDADFEPGERWSYNNGAYMLLTAAIEKITAKPLDDVLRERIFTPVGMHQTMLRRWDSDFVPNSATLHFRGATGVFSKTHMGMEISGAGGMVSTMDDMLLWLRHMDAPTVGSSETWQRMIEPQMLNSGHSTNYGLGLMRETYRGAVVIHHAGGVMGGNSQMIKMPDAGLDISIGVNRADVSGVTLALKVIDACVEGLAPQPDKQEYAKRTGTFVSMADGRVIALSAADDMQMMSVDGGAPTPVSPDAEGTLHLPDAAAFLQQRLRLDGNSLIFSDFGNEDVLSEIETDSEAKLGDRAGAYRSEALDATFTLMEDSDGARGRMHGRHGWADYMLTPVTTDIWRIEQTVFAAVSGILTLATDGKSLTLDFGRMRHMGFVKV
ncbi:CubicO group peptidase (beta-lactamase class C family) [Sphingopyxis panaciterrae]|nr:CubicO group peptidase (beta-lactamase class C family) [Sphingopyxis panaciterrae]